MGNFEHVRQLQKRLLNYGPSFNTLQVCIDGKMVYENWEGYADYANKIPVERDTIFRIYSMTKTITCFAALMLWERGLFLLNDPLEEYLPQFKDIGVYRQDNSGGYYVDKPKSLLLVKNLFAMNGGITYAVPGGKTEEDVRDKLKALEKTYGHKNYTIEQHTDIIASTPLAYDPGTQWRYSLSHNVLARLIEVLSGKPYDRFVTEEIFQPLGMKDSYFELPEEKRSRMCKQYRFSTDQSYEEFVHPVPYPGQYKYIAADSDIVCTIDDITAISQALACGQWKGERILGRKTVDLMRTNQLDEAVRVKYFAHGRNKGFGYGLGVRTYMYPAEGAVNLSKGTFGWNGMGGSFFYIDPDERMSITYGMNCIPHHADEVHPRITNAVCAAL